MLRDLGSNKNSRFATLKKPIKDITANSKDKQFIELFNLKEENEVLIQGEISMKFRFLIIFSEYSCYMKGIVKEYGRLYVSSHYVCYFSQVFGKRTRIALPIATIESVSCDNDKKKILIKAKKKKVKKMTVTKYLKFIVGTSGIRRSKSDNGSDFKCTRQNQTPRFKYR